jgi:hypothetical protein
VERKTPGEGQTPSEGPITLVGKVAYTAFTFAFPRHDFRARLNHAIASRPLLTCTLDHMSRWRLRHLSAVSGGPNRTKQRMDSQWERFRHWGFLCDHCEVDYYCYLR